MNFEKKLSKFRNEFKEELVPEFVDLIINTNCDKTNIDKLLELADPLERSSEDFLNLTRYHIGALKHSKKYKDEYTRRSEEIIQSIKK